jgi:hypothetical protein
MECNFIPGQKVVCIDDLFPETYVKHGLILPVRDQVYTVRDIVIENFVDETCPALYLQEIRNKVFRFAHGVFDHELPFAFWRFRPLSEDDEKSSKSAKAPFDFNTLLNDLPPDLIEEVKREKEEVPV